MLKVLDRMKREILLSSPVQQDILAKKNQIYHTIYEHQSIKNNTQSARKIQLVK